MQAHGLGDAVSVAQRDVCADGFPDELRAAAHAVMLDLPAPEKAVPHALAALTPGASLFYACFSTLMFVKRMELFEA